VAVTSPVTVTTHPSGVAVTVPLATTPAAVEVTMHSPSKQVTVPLASSPPSVTLLAHGSDIVVDTTVTVPGPSGTPTAKNVILVTIENTGIANLEAYDDINRWPSGHVYASTPWLDAKVADGIRYTNFRGHARATSTRASILTGRVPHKTTAHDGAIFGDEPASGGFYAGLGAAYFPWPDVLRQVDSSYARQLFGQFDLGQVSAGTTDWGFAVTGTGFSKSSIQKHFKVDNWAYKPGMLYDDFPEYIKDGTAALVTTASVTSPILPAKTAERVIDYFGSLSASDQFVVSWDISYCEELFPAFDQTETVDGNLETLHTTFTLGQLHTSATGYGNVSNTNLGWRRPISMRETLDALLQLAEDALPAEVAADTVWVIAGASGPSNSELLPRAETWTQATDGRTVQPPTIDGTTDSSASNAYYTWYRGEGSVYEPSTRVPLIIAGAVPTQSKGQDCAALIEAADLFPTILEIVSGIDWKVPIVAAGAFGQLDGESFAHTLGSTSAAHRTHSLSEIVTPAGDTALGFEEYSSIAVVNTSSWKLLRSYNSFGTSWQLYDLNTDPDEKTDLYPPSPGTQTTQYNDLLAALNARIA